MQNKYFLRGKKRNSKQVAEILGTTETAIFHRITRINKKGNLKKNKENKLIIRAIRYLNDDIIEFLENDDNFKGVFLKK